MNWYSPMLGLLLVCAVYWFLRYLMIPFYARSAKDGGLISDEAEKKIRNWALELATSNEALHSAVQLGVNEKRRNALLRHAANLYREEGGLLASDRIECVLEGDRLCSEGNYEAAADVLACYSPATVGEATDSGAKGTQLDFQYGGNARLDALVDKIGERIEKNRLFERCVEEDGFEGARRWLGSLIEHNAGAHSTFMCAGTVLEERLKRVSSAAPRDLAAVAHEVFLDRGSLYQVERAIAQARAGTERAS